MKNARLTTTFLALILAAATLSACGKSNDTSSNNVGPSAAQPSANTPNLAALTKPDNAAQLANKALPSGDANQPLTSYRTLQSGNDLMFLYYGLSNMPVDYDKVAQSYSQDYRGTQDSFKKQDLLTSLKPHIDAEIQSAKNSRYVMMSVSGVSLNAYDFSKKGFAVNNFGQAGQTQFFFDNSTYQAEYTNGPNFAFLPVSDETAARQIENMRSQFKPLTLRVYAYAQDGDPAANHVKLQILHLQLVDANNQVLMAD